MPRSSLPGCLLVFAFLFGIISCSGELPSIVSLRWTLIQTSKGSGSEEERLSVFASVSDPDGPGDVESLYVSNDASRIFWRLGPEKWIERSDSSGRWIGSSGLSLPEGGRLPRGTYKVLVKDAAGETDERQFSLLDPGPPPSISLRISGDDLTATSPYSQTHAVFLDAAGNTVSSVPVVPGKNSLSALLGSSLLPKARRILLLSVSDSKNLAVMTKAVELP